MKVIMRTSRLLALVIALAAGAFVLNLALPESTQKTQATNHELLPDLITLEPPYVDIVTVQYRVKKVVVTERRLRLSNVIGNQGEGPLEMYPVSADCDNDGDVQNDRLVFQRIFGNTNGVAGFQRGEDAVVDEHPVGCHVFHPKHRHWHLQDFSKYELLDGTGNVVASADKVSFCVIDTDPLPGATTPPYYDSCGRNVDLGLSSGWADMYGYWLAGQYIILPADLTGTYCLLSTADPANHIRESDETNNATGVVVTINGDTVTPGSSCS